MKSLILCRTLHVLRRCLPPPPEPIRYLILGESRQSMAVRAYLNQRGAAEELPRAALFRERSTRSRDAYVAALGRLNAERACRDWWAMPFTTKNPISTELCRDIFAYRLITELILQRDEVMVVITERERLAGQLELWGSTEGVAVVNAVSSCWTLRRLVMRLAPLAILLLTARALWFKLRVGRRIPELPAKATATMAMVTLAHPHSIGEDGRYRDTYFGWLSEWLAKANAHVVVAGVVQGQSVSLAHAFWGTEQTVTRLPIDSVMSLWDIVQVTWEALHAWYAASSPAVSCEVERVDIGYLVARAIRDAHASGQVYQSISFYRCARRLASRIAITRCLYPYENRAWEKMLLLGFRTASPQTRMVGYQHASITASHTNFVLAEKEMAITPMPDVIVTMGEVTRDWLIREGHHPPALLKVGCALRQPRTGSTVCRPRRTSRVTRVLVALATNLNEYVLTLRFLEKAFKEQNGRTVRIRPHPTIALDDALQLSPMERAGFQYEVSTGTVTNDLAWADVVLYASSTIGLEAVGMGIPAVYLDLGDILDTDPLGGWYQFKWTAQEPVDLPVVLNEIEALTDSDYGTRQQMSQSYAQAYMASVTDGNLRVFCEA